MSKALRTGEKHSISSAFIFLLIGLYAVFSLLLVLIGVGAYQNAVQDTQSNEKVRTSLNYIANKVRAADAVDAVAVEEWHGIPSLLLKQWIDGSPYETRIYYLPNPEGEGGAVYEHFVYRGDDWGPEEGMHIVDVSALSIEQEGNLLSLTLKTLEGRTFPLHLRLRAAAR